MCTCDARLSKSERAHSRQFLASRPFRSWSHVNAPAQKSSEIQFLWSYNCRSVAPKLTRGQNPSTVVCFWTSTTFNAALFPGWCKSLRLLMIGWSHRRAPRSVRFRCLGKVVRSSLMIADNGLFNNLWFYLLYPKCPQTNGSETFCKRVSLSPSLEFHKQSTGRQFLASRSVLVNATALLKPPTPAA